MYIAIQGGLIRSLLLSHLGEGIESRRIPKGGFGLTPGKLLTQSKPNPYPKSVLITPAQKLRKIPNL